MYVPAQVRRTPVIPGSYLYIYDVAPPGVWMPRPKQVQVGGTVGHYVFTIDVKSVKGPVQTLPVYIATLQTSPTHRWDIQPFGAKSDYDETLSQDREKYVYSRVTVNPRAAKDQAQDHVLVVEYNNSHAFVESLKAQTSIFHESVIPPLYLAKYGLTAWPDTWYHNLRTAYLKSAAQSSSPASGMEPSKAWHIDWMDTDGKRHDSLPILVAVLHKAEPNFMKDSGKREWRIFKSRNFKERLWNFKERRVGLSVEPFTATYPASSWVCYRAHPLTGDGQPAVPQLAHHLLLVPKRHAELFAEALTAPKLSMSRPASLTRTQGGDSAGLGPSTEQGGSLNPNRQVPDGRTPGVQGLNERSVPRLQKPIPPNRGKTGMRTTPGSSNVIGTSTGSRQ